MKLGVNIDHIATLRQARGESFPDPVWAAGICKKAGADSVVMHLREDRRHVQDSDLFQVRKEVAIELNLEMSIAESVVKVAKKLCPDKVTLVPEKRKERTTESGLDLFSDSKKLRELVACFKKKDIEVSLFIDPDLKQVDEAKRLGVQAVEFHTGYYANQKNIKTRQKEIDRIRTAVNRALSLGLLAHAGHGLDYENVIPITKIKDICELNIGFSIVSKALEIGLENAVRRMKKMIA